MDGKSKKAMTLAILLGGKKKAPKEPALPETSDDDVQPEEEGYKSAAEEVISAIKAEDAAALVEALKSFVEMCGSEDHADEDAE